MNKMERHSIYDSSSCSTNIEQSAYHEEITKLRTELIALKPLVVEQLHFIEQSVHEPFEVEKKLSARELYIKAIGRYKLNFLKQENKTKISLMQSLIQSGNTNSCDNDNSYSKSSKNDENNDIENNDINIHIPNDDSNITMRVLKIKINRLKINVNILTIKTKTVTKLIAKTITTKIILGTNTIKAGTPAVVV